MMVLTLDDVYHDSYTHGFALAQELQVPITIFLIPGYIESGNYFWWLEPDRLIRHTQVNKVTIEGQTYCLEQPEERNRLAQTIDARARHATSIAEREVFLATVREVLAVPPSITAEEEVRPLTWTEVRKMEESGWVSFGAHTMHHHILAYLANSTEVRWEVEECRTVLERQLGHLIRTFAFPVGKPEDIGDLALRAVRKGGYDWSVTTIYGTNTPQSDPYLLRRVAGEVGRHWLVLAAETSGVWRFF